MPTFENLIIQTPRLSLRPFDNGDEPALHSIFSDPLVMRFWSEPPWSSPDEATGFVERGRRGMSTGESLQLAIVRKADNSVIGMCTLFSFSPQCRRAEIGYALASSDWGKGYMHEALMALLSFAFSELGLHRVEADIDPRNEASARSLERLGFVKEGLLRDRWIVDGMVSDTALYGLLHADWTRVRVEADWRSRGFGFRESTCAPGDVWTDRGHGVDEVVMIASGSAEGLVSGTVCSTVGKEFVIPAGTPHEIRNTGTEPSRVFFGYRESGG